MSAHSAGYILSFVYNASRCGLRMVQTMFQIDTLITQLLIKQRYFWRVPCIRNAL